MGDYLRPIFDGIIQTLTQHASFFESSGMTLFRAFAIILLVWLGIQSALSSTEGGSGFSWSRFAALLQQLSFVYAMEAYYSTPIPGIGISFTHLILDQAAWLVSQLDQSRLQQVIHTLDGVEMYLPYPTPYDLLAILRFGLMEVVIILAEAVTLFVVMYGYVATAVLILLGPIFIPFKVVPEMDWMFWGWFRAFIQYAFYRVVASAYLYVFADVLIDFFGAGTTPLSTQQFAARFVPMMIVLVVFLLGMTKVPALTFSLFSGRSGDYVFPSWR